MAMAFVCRLESSKYTVIPTVVFDTSSMPPGMPNYYWE